VAGRGRTHRDEQYGLLTSIAGEAGVSLSTVSKVVHRRHDVGAATRARVEELLTRYGYVRPGEPDPAVPRQIIAVFRDLSGPYPLEVVRGIVDAADDLGIDVVTGTTAQRKFAHWVDGGATDKQWTLVASTGGYYKLRSVRHTGLFMTGAAANGALDTAIDPSTNAAADDSQEWQLVRDPLPTEGTFTLKGANSGRRLDVPNGQTGVQVQVYDCVGNANQTISQTAAGELRVSGKCLAADGDGITAGTKLILWTCNGKSSQRWWFRLDGSVINRSNGLAIDVATGGRPTGRRCKLWTALGNATPWWSRG
jgi:hypothetical protein